MSLSQFPFFFFFLSLSVVFQTSSALWPLPRSIMKGSSNAFLRLDSSFTITFDSSALTAGAPQDLLNAIKRTENHIWTDKLGRLAVGRGVNDLPSVRSAPSLGSLILSLRASSNSTINSITAEAQKAPDLRNEVYNLTLADDGSPATLSAETTLGLFRGLTTFEQMWYYATDGDSEETYAAGVPVDIIDRPAFPHRGLMLDTARNFFSISDIKRTLDTMSLVKMSTFHWHITDSQSFPLQLSSFEELAAQGAYSNSSIFTVDDVKDIVQYAGERGIDVLVEIDSPGHSAAIGESHPEHIACFHALDWSAVAGEPPSGQLRIASNDTVNFTSSLFAAAAQMFPSTLFSTGGDEVNLPCYESDLVTQEQLGNRSIEDALNSFVMATHSALREEGKTPVVWEEMVLEQNVTLGNDTVVMVWISSQDAAAVAEKGFRIIHGPSDYFYLDCGGGEWLGNDIGNSWCDPFKTWQKAYSFPPFANLTSTQQSLILGGQQLLWTEQSSPQNLDPIVWPRAAASAEVFWSFPLNVSKTAFDENNGALNATTTDALARIHDIRYRMVQRGVSAIALQPEWCALRPGQCDG